jgi:uncharacterized protein YozE (UPF0346 family)
MFCSNEKNKKDLILKRNIFEYFKPILTSLFKEIKYQIKKSNSETKENNDQIKIICSYDDKNNKYYVNLNIFTEKYENVLFNVTTDYILRVKESIIWRHTSLCQIYLLVEI